jgi:hypothetical protein
MIGIIYLFVSWLLITLLITFMLPAHERSLGRVASIELVMILLWLVQVATFL